jgi:tetratricopeptide (TPR) repeat protein
VSTASSDAQVWFDRGLNWLYAFHNEEAERCFQRAIDADPLCAMAHWGLAYAIGPYYNGPWVRMAEPQRAEILARAHRLVLTATDLASDATDVEKALIAALHARFPTERNESQEIFDSWDDDYAEAMRQVCARFPHDLDVVAFTVDALVVRTPWRLWDLAGGVAAEGSDTVEAITLLEECFSAHDDAVINQHPGLLHFWVHIMEMSPTPERALEQGVALQMLCPDAAHLIHMASHIQILCGQYNEALETNVAAVVADDKYVSVHPELGVYTAYRMHNIHFQIYAAMFLGNFAKAIAAADLIHETVTPEALRTDNAFLVRYLEAFYGMKVHVLIRFGRWDDIVDAPLPDDPDLFVTTTALWHYAKGVAHAATGNIDQAEHEQRLFLKAWNRVPEDHFVFNNQSRDVLRVGEAMLAGELEYRKGNHDLAFEHLRRSAHIDDTLYYNEPWVWMQPPRHALGALLLEQGRVEEAAEVYRADLGMNDSLVRSSQHLGNVWALHGYAECCESLGLHTEAAQVRAELEVAKAGMDVALTSSCFCRGAGEIG